jgi:D-glycero-alpha-D-manno-heptose-7-phosphate kinase
MVISRTPLRVSFVGGGTDLPQFYQRHGGAVISTTIDKYIYVLVNERFEPDVRVSYSRTEIVPTIDQLQHYLIREALRIAGIPRKVEIVTVADVPARGTGLGSSSAVAVGVLNALFAYQGILKAPAELASDAARIEIEVLDKPIGKQDQYACALGGLQLIRFGPGNSIRCDPVILKPAQRHILERSLLCFYTGRQRSAAAVLEALRASHHKPAIQENLSRMRDLALDLYEKLSSDATPDALGKYLHENWLLKRELDPRISTSKIDRWYRLAMEAGSLGGKLLGAGESGFLLLYAPPAAHERIRSVLTELREMPIRLEPYGTRIIHVGR